MPTDRPVAAATRHAPHEPVGHAEWLLVDGAGGYASGCVDGLPRRRYHALWIVRRAGGARRFLCVAGLDERIVRGADVTFLMRAHWRSEAVPNTVAAPTTFARWPVPTWTFAAAGGQLERSVALRAHGPEVPAALLVRYRNRTATAMRLDVRPLLGWHDADHLPPADDAYDATVQAQGASWGVRPNPTLPTLWLTADGVATFRGEPAWYRGFLFATDRDRGYDHVGDRWVPGVLELELGPGQEATVAFALAEPCAAAADAFDAVFAAARAADAAVARQADPLFARLGRTAGDFLYRAEGNRLGVLAGFPWFQEWGRDVFVSLPGLTLARGRADLCAEVLRGALPFLRRGLLPNVYGPDAAASHYDSCDAALWFALAVQRFADAGGDRGFLRDALLPALAAIAAHYEAGTELGLAVDAAGLLRAGREDLNATWMDARIGSVPVTPRGGLPVEIQALWCSLLEFLAEHDDKRWRAASTRAAAAFVQQFWLPGEQRLADRVHDGGPDRAVRPNMLVAAALSRSPLSSAQRRAVVAAARAELVTPVGLRTLSPQDPSYRGRYEGSGESRDRAYHQGTVWPWLAGFYVEAALAAVPKKTRKAEALALRAWLDGFLPELDRQGLDHVSEVYDGDAPQRPGGTFAQAWNSGELLRALCLCAEAAK
jgi:predicted glycogen debranching enzyme